MATRVPLYGTTAIYTALSNAGSNTSGAIALLGYSINGVEIEEEIYSEEVHGDQNGGHAGPPIEIVQHGEIHRIRMVLSRWDEAVLQVLREYILASGGVNTASGNGVSQSLGAAIPAGTLVFSNFASFRLVLSQPNYTQAFCRSYPICLFNREPKVMNMASGAAQLPRTGWTYKDGNGNMSTAGSGAVASTLGYVPPV